MPVKGRMLETRGRYEQGAVVEVDARRFARWEQAGVIEAFVERPTRRALAAVTTDEEAPAEPAVEIEEQVEPEQPTRHGRGRKRGG
jgi:hypothetical protein